jgi:hypothetical protein
MVISPVAVDPGIASQMTENLLSYFENQNGERDSSAYYRLEKVLHMETDIPCSARAKLVRLRLCVPVLV